ncbi:AAA family ATPase [Mycobacterium sp. LTG2003]
MGESRVLVVLSGLPGVGKTTVARRVSERLGAAHLRIDTIEAAMVRSGLVAAAGGWDNAPDAGYQVAYSVATDLLRAGHDVIADSVNPLAVTRRAWAAVAGEVNAVAIDIEIVCSDSDLHRERVETRTSDLDGLVVPTWEQVMGRRYEPWSTPVLRVDTAQGAGAAAEEIVATVRARFLSS